MPGDSIELFLQTIQVHLALTSGGADERGLAGWAGSHGPALGGSMDAAPLVTEAGQASMAPLLSWVLSHPSATGESSEACPQPDPPGLAGLRRCYVANAARKAALLQL